VPRLAGYHDKPLRTMVDMKIVFVAYSHPDNNIRAIENADKSGARGGHPEAPLPEIPLPSRRRPVGS
jgi:hypothetical protein